MEHKIKKMENKKCQKSINNKTNIDINLDDLFEEIYKEYGEKSENKGKYFSFDDYIIKKYPNSKKDNLSYYLYLEFKKKYNKQYKNLILTKYSEKINIHVTNATFFFNEVDSLKKISSKYSVILTFSILIVLTIGLDFFNNVMNFNIYYVFFTVFLLINIFMFFVYGIEIILIISGAYFLTKSVLLILNSIEIINLPYIKYFDPNIYNYSLILICLIISIPMIIKFISMVVFIPAGIIKICKKNSVENHNDSLIKISKIYDISESIIKRYNEIITKITTIRGVTFDFFVINKYKKFMYCYMLISLFCCFLLKFDFNMYYYSENNGYCKNIGNKVYINRLDKNENIVHILASKKLPKHDEVYSFTNMNGIKKYVYEASCERGLIKYNLERVYSTDDLWDGWAPANTKIIVYGTFINNGDSVDKYLLVTNDGTGKHIDDLRFIRLKINDIQSIPEGLTTEVIVLGENIENKEFEIYEIITIDDKKNAEKLIYEAKKRLKKYTDK